MSEHEIKSIDAATLRAFADVRLSLRNTGDFRASLAATLVDWVEVAIRTGDDRRLSNALIALSGPPPFGGEWEQVSLGDIEKAASNYQALLHDCFHARAACGEPADEAYLRGQREGFGVGYIRGLRKAGAVEVVDPTDTSICGFAIRHDKQEPKGSDK